MDIVLRNVLYDYGDFVYLQHDPGQDIWQVTGYLVLALNRFVYEIRSGNRIMYCDGYELGSDKNQQISLGLSGGADKYDD